MAASDLRESKLSFHLACQYRGVETRRLLAFLFRGGYRGRCSYQRRGGDSRLHLGFNLEGIVAIIDDLIAFPIFSFTGRHLRVWVRQPVMCAVA